MADHVHEDGNRRDFLLVAGTTFAAVGGALAAWPLIDQMNPDAAAQSLASIEVDLKPIEEGQSITVLWRGKPIFIRRRTKSEVDSAKAVKVADLPDGSARNMAKPERTPATDENRTVAGHENWLVLIGICTHLGCIPRGQAKGDVKGEFGGWFCPCHGSHYDTAGRIRKGPAPRNLEVPPYAFLNDTRIKIG